MANVKSPVAISVIVVALLIRLSNAVNHNVGGPNGSWDTNTNLKSWATSTTFAVGDSLVFQYTMNHDVTEVPKADYDSCQAANPIGTYSGGSTVISLDSPGKRYFICTTPGHCSQGMKLEIDTVTASSSPPPESPATPPPSESTATPPPESNAAAPPPQAPSSPKSSPPSSAPPPAVAESPKSSPKSSPPASAPPPAVAESPKSSPKSSPPASAPPPAVAESPKSSANKDSFGVTAAIGLCTGLVVFLAI